MNTAKNLVEPPLVDDSEHLDVSPGPSVVVGVVDACEGPVPHVNFPGNLDIRPVQARTCVPVASLRVGAQVALAFENGDLLKPIIVGLLQTAISDQHATMQPIIEMDGQRIAFTAQKEIVLRCGKASIQLLSDGSVFIRGGYVLSRASGTNRIRGGNVQIN